MARFIIAKDPFEDMIRGMNQTPRISEGLKDLFNDIDQQIRLETEKKDKESEGSYSTDLLEEIMRRQNLMLEKQLQLQQQIVDLSEKIEKLIDRNKK